MWVSTHVLIVVELCLRELRCTWFCHKQAASPTPVFGSSSTFGAGTGFGGFAGVNAAASSHAEDETPPEEGTGETEEECQAEFRPLVQLEEVERVSGEEGETTLVDL